MGHDAVEDEDDEHDGAREHVPCMVTRPLEERQHRRANHEQAQRSEGHHAMKSGNPFSECRRARCENEHEKQGQQKHAERMPADGVPKSLSGDVMGHPMISGGWPLRLFPNPELSITRLGNRDFISHAK